MSPKSLLRHPKCKSGLWEFDDLPDDAGGYFVLELRLACLCGGEGLVVGVASCVLFDCWPSQSTESLATACMQLCIMSPALPLHDACPH